MKYEDRETLIKEITVQIEEIMASEKEEIFPALSDMTRYFPVWFEHAGPDCSDLSYSEKTDLIWIAVRRASVTL